MKYNIRINITSLPHLVIDYLKLYSLIVLEDLIITTALTIFNLSQVTNRTIVLSLDLNTELYFLKTFPASSYQKMCEQFDEYSSLEE